MLLQLWPSLRSLTSSFSGLQHTCSNNDNVNNSDGILCHPSLHLNTSQASHIEWYFAALAVLLLLSVGVTIGMLLQQRKHVASNESDATDYTAATDKKDRTTQDKGVAAEHKPTEKTKAIDPSKVSTCQSLSIPD